MPEKGKEDFGDPIPYLRPEVPSAENFRGQGRSDPLTEDEWEETGGVRSKISLDFFDEIKY